MSYSVEDQADKVTIDWKEETIIKDFEVSVQNSPEAKELFGDALDGILNAADKHDFFEIVPILKWVVKTQKAVQDIRNFSFYKKIYSFLAFTSRYSKGQIAEFFDEYSCANEENGYESMLLVLERLDNYNKVGVMTRLLKAKLEGKLSMDNFIRLTCSLQLVPYVDLKRLPDYIQSTGTRYDTYMLLAAGLLYQSAIGIDGVGESEANQYQLNDSGVLFVKYGLGIDVSTYVKNGLPISTTTDEDIEELFKKDYPDVSKCLNKPNVK